MLEPKKFDRFAPSPHLFHSRFRSIAPIHSLHTRFWQWILSCLILLATVALVGCTPAQPDTSEAALTAQTERIALEFAASGDLEAARTALTQVEVANANQWLVLVTEEAVTRAPKEESTDALVALVGALGLRSSILERYLAGQNVVAEAVEPTATQSELPTATAVVEPTPVPTDLPVVNTEPVEATTTDVPTPAITTTPALSTSAQVQAISPMNVRAGPSTGHPIIAAMQAGSTALILAKNSGGDWWQIELGNGASGWIYAPLVEVTGNIAAVAVAAAIPTLPPPTDTPVPQSTVAPPPATQPPQAPAEQPTQPPVEVPATDTPAPPPSSGSEFRLVEQRLWDVVENGGFLAGGVSVNCGEKQVLQVVVEDANGSRLNGVTIKGVYRNEIHVTGEKGEGVAELDVNKDGDDIMVIRDVDGREVTSDRAVGNTARTWDIPFSQLIQGRFCSDDASCQKFVGEHGCFGHFSWTVRFRRSY